MILRRMLGLVSLVASVSACTTKAETPAADTPVNTSPEAGGAAHVDMIRLDTAKKPSAAAPSKAPSSKPASPARKDTSVVLRDSASGPRMEIDASGKTRPIKK